MSRHDDQGLINLAWAYALMDAFASEGIRHVFAAPGSRSTPLIIAASLHPQLMVDVHFDERGTAFMALGAARATGLPALWITTSGTAVANGMPAVVEASVDGIPLILLTADRPPELRQTGANQTINQVEFFGRQVRSFVDVPPPAADADLRSAAELAHVAVSSASGVGPGPVHLNCMFREPLAPASLESFPPRSVEATSDVSNERAEVSVDDLEALRIRVAKAKRGLIVVGRLADREDGLRVLGIGEALNWPVLPDILSGIRVGGQSRLVIPHYDLILAAGATPPEEPDLVLHFGDRSVSKRLGSFLSECGADVINIRRDDRPLVHGRRDRNIIANVVDVSDSLAAHESENGGWLQAWQAANRSVEAFLARRFREAELSEPLVARMLMASLNESDSLMIGSSMPIRDIDMFAEDSGMRPFVFGNRGASGIDGTIATAVGMARAVGRPLTVFLGDLALLHDINSLAAMRSLDTPCRIVVINNDGGGIFSMLPVHSLTGVFEPLFGTPHGLGFRCAAEMFGLEYHRPETTVELDGILRTARSTTTTLTKSHSLIEIRTERGANATVHRELLRDLKAHLGS